MESVSKIPEAACPWACGSLDRMKEEISSHLQAEIRSGFANLLVQLTSEIQSLSRHRSVNQRSVSHRNIQTVYPNQPEHGSDRTLPSIRLKSEHCPEEPRAATDTDIPRKAGKNPDTMAGERESMTSLSFDDRTTKDTTFSADVKPKVLAISSSMAISNKRSTIGGSFSGLFSCLLKKQRRSEEARRMHAKHTVAHIISDQPTTFSSSLEQTIFAIRNRRLKLADSPQNCLVRLVLSQFFSVFSVAMITANAIWLGYECDYLIGHPSDQRVGWLQDVDLVFTIWFMVELLLRLVALNRLFIFGDDWQWNLVDLALVLFSIPTLVAPGMNMTFFRVVRLLKVSRALRLVRLARFFGNLREIVVSIFYTLGSLFWCFVTLAIATYLFATVLQQWRLSNMEEGMQYSKEINDKFKNTWEAMLLLFSMISGGQDWYHIAQEFDKKSDYVSKIALLCYIFVVAFGVLNVIIGVFCAKANDASSNDEHLCVRRHQEQTTKRINDLIQVFNEMDVCEEGQVGEMEVMDYFSKMNSKWILQCLGLELLEGKNLWKLLLYEDGSLNERASSLDLPSFVMGMLRLAGSARSMELVMLSMQIEQLQNALVVNEDSIRDLNSALNSSKASGNSVRPPSRLTTQIQQLQSALVLNESSIRHLNSEMNSSSASGNSVRTPSVNSVAVGVDLKTL